MTAQQHDTILKSLYGIIATLITTMIIGGVVMYGSLSAIANNDKNQDSNMVRIERSHESDIHDMKEDIKEIRKGINKLLENK